MWQRRLSKKKEKIRNLGGFVCCISIMYDSDDRGESQGSSPRWLWWICGASKRLLLRSVRREDNSPGSVMG